MCTSKPSVPKPEPAPPVPEVASETPLLQTEAESGTRKKPASRRGLSALRIDLSVPESGGSGLRIPR